MYIYAQDSSQQYLGYITHDRYHSESIINEYGSYGSSYGLTSIRNEFSSYGSDFGLFSAYNEFSINPPIIYSWNGSYFEPEAYLTKNHFLAGTTVDPDVLIQYLLDPPTLPAVLAMDGSVSYNINEDQVTLMVDKIINSSIGSISGLLSLKLWATDTMYSGAPIFGYVLGSYQFTELLIGGYYFEDIVQTVQLIDPPAGTYYITMTLSEWNGSSDLIVDYLTFSDTVNFDTEPTPDMEDTDSDADEIPENADTDDDNDGYLDDQDAFPLDPTEWSQAPDIPVLSLPTDGETGVSLTPELQTEAFSDPDSGDTHAQSQWQLSTESDLSTLLLDTTSSSHLTSLTVPDAILEEGTTYYWRVRFYDNHDAASDWPDPYSCLTLTTSADTDSNGIPDVQEVDETVDLDNNGTPDIDQDNMKCVNTVVGDGQVGVKEGTNVTSIDSLSSIDPDTISDTENKPEEMPRGLISFKVKVDTAGDTAEVTVYLSDPAPSNAKWYKYDLINGWQDYSEHATFSADRTSVTLVLKDGGFGDADGVANGIIVDPSGLGVENQSPTASFTATPTSGETPLNVSFDATASSDPDGTIDSYDWAFGDGSTGYGITTSHQYTSASTYTVTLTVTDDDGDTDTATVTITVTASAPSSEGDDGGGGGGGCFISVINGN